jgi:vacuolar-type H+-ATPase subunit I/STV1
MPPIFKALATIMAWIMWICALVCGFSTAIMGIVTGDLFSTTAPPSMIYPAFFAVAGFDAILAVVIMLIRKKME